VSEAIVDALRPFRKIGAEALLIPPFRFLIVGDELLVRGDVKTRIKKPNVISLTLNQVPKQSLSEYRKLLDSAETLGRRSLAEFSLSKSILRRIKTLAKELNSTHVRIFTHDERGIVARLFDVRIGSDLLLPKNKRIHASATLNVTENVRKAFSITLTTETLNMFPADDHLISIYDDGILEAEPINGKLKHVFVCRDQGINEPYTSFVHEKLDRTVYFVSHPSS